MISQNSFSATAENRFLFPESPNEENKFFHVKYLNLALFDDLVEEMTFSNFEDVKFKLSICTVAKGTSAFEVIEDIDDVNALAKCRLVGKFSLGLIKSEIPLWLDSTTIYGTFISTLASTMIMDKLFIHFLQPESRWGRFVLSIVSTLVGGYLAYKGVLYFDQAIANYFSGFPAAELYYLYPLRNTLALDSKFTIKSSIQQFIEMVNVAHQKFLDSSVN